MKAASMKNSKLSLWERIKRWFRRLIYPRKFDVTLRDAQNKRSVRLKFKALDKGEMTGRFFGNCVEEIIITHEDFEALWSIKALIKAELKKFFS